MIHPDYNNKLYKQDYSIKPRIDGVKLVDIPYFSDDGGSFCELFRRDGDASFAAHFLGFDLKQINWSIIGSGLIKAGHVHKQQEDIWFVPPTDKVLVGLIDAREGSATRGVTMRFVLGAGRARFLYIPRGVVHGCSNPYNRGMMLLYFVNQYWTSDPYESDEYRIDYREFGAGFWEIAKG